MFQVVTQNMWPLCNPSNVFEDPDRLRANRDRIVQGRNHGSVRNDIRMDGKWEHQQLCEGAP